MYQQNVGLQSSTRKTHNTRDLLCKIAVSLDKSFVAINGQLCSYKSHGTGSSPMLYNNGEGPAWDRLTPPLIF
jgi:hypothetical protein